jgi:hypothetical protein
MYCKIVPFGLFAAASFDAGCGLDGSVVSLVVFGLRLGAMLRRMFGHLIEIVPVETVQ